MTQKLCAKLMTLNGWGFVILGLVWVTTAFAGFDTPGRLLIDLLHWPVNGYPAAPSMEARWMGGIGAGLTVAIGLMFIFIFAPLVRTGGMIGKLVRKGIIISLSAWFIVDGAGSIAAGAPSNVVFNFIFYLLAVVPLIMSKFTD